MGAHHEAAQVVPSPAAPVPASATCTISPLRRGRRRKSPSTTDPCLHARSSLDAGFEKRGEVAALQQCLVDAGQIGRGHRGRQRPASSGTARRAVSPSSVPPTAVHGPHILHVPHIRTGNRELMRWRTADTYTHLVFFTGVTHRNYPGGVLKRPHFVVLCSGGPELPPIKRGSRLTRAFR